MGLHPGNLLLHHHSDNYWSELVIAKIPCETLLCRLWPLCPRDNFRQIILYFLCHHRDPSDALRDSRHWPDYRHADDHHLGQVQAETQTSHGETQTEEKEEAREQVIVICD